MKAAFDKIEVGHALGPMQVPVTAALVKQYAFCLDDYRSWHLGTASPFGGAVAHAALLANDLLAVKYSHYDRSSFDALHTMAELSFHAPMPVGDTATITGRFTDKSVRGDRGYLVMEAEARDGKGNLLVSHRQIDMMHVPAGTVADGVNTPSSNDRIDPRTIDVEPIDKAAPEIAPGTPMMPKTKAITQGQISLYSFVGEHERNIHNDIALARQHGYESTIAQGMQVAGYVSELCTDFFGAAWFTTGRLKAKFLLPVFPGSTLTVAGKIASQDARRNAVTTRLEIWVKDQDGRLVSVAWASARHHA